MKRFAVVFALLAGCVVVNASDLRSEIEAMNKVVQSAFLKRDIGAFEKAVKSRVTKDFKYSEEGKSMSFDQMVALMKQSFAMSSKVTKADSKIMSLKEKGNSGTCTTSHDMVMVMVDEKKKTHTMGFAGTSTETFVKEKGKWLMSSMTWGEQKMTMDGKPYPAAPAAGAKKGG